MEALVVAKVYFLDGAIFLSLDENVGLWLMNVQGGLHLPESIPEIRLDLGCSLCLGRYSRG